MNDVEPLGETVGGLVRELRAREGLSQRALGERAGLSQSYIDRIEHNQIEMRLSTLRRVFNALGYTIAAVADQQMEALRNERPGRGDRPLIDLEDLP